MLIRPCATEDLARLVELTVETFGPFYEESFRPLVGEVVFANQHGHWREDYRAEVPRLHDPGSHRHVAVAELAGAVGGYVAWSVEPAKRNGTISHVAVAAEHRRGGVATRLCEHAFAAMKAQGAEVVEIGTGGDPFHAPARALYERLGCTALPLTVYYREL
ncbi:GNAT family N-acetyltransferase [Amycolatopsis sp.]|uniref:GNAT family N-acetyltransferase n=1 Tax=Amycolatopsis sp. TaxID=37632 RepID=UPI002D80237C|nr:GNAT family N-acetyltransferase [Amycolatopsis sp.]HET6710784.1 GNAT family N-acetyltransferase [Amycolatopsis sp.]